MGLTRQSQASLSRRLTDGKRKRMETGDGLARFLTESSQNATPTVSIQRVSLPRRRCLLVTFVILQPTSSAILNKGGSGSGCWIILMTAYAGHAHTATPVAIGNRGGYTNIFVGTNGARIVRLRDDSARLVSQNRKLGPFYLSTNINRAKVEDQSSKDGARPVHGFGAKKAFHTSGSQ